MRTGAVLNFARFARDQTGCDDGFRHMGVFIWKEFASAPLNARKLIALFLDQIDTEVQVSLKVS
jgi:hypothetical protein